MIAESQNQSEAISLDKNYINFNCRANKIRTKKFGIAKEEVVIEETSELNADTFDNVD